MQKCEVNCISDHIWTWCETDFEIIGYCNVRLFRLQIRYQLDMHINRIWTGILNSVLLLWQANTLLMHKDYLLTFYTLTFIYVHIRLCPEMNNIPNIIIYKLYRTLIWHFGLFMMLRGYTLNLNKSPNSCSLYFLF